MPILLQLFWTFLKIGAFTFGGGYAMIAVITDLCVERKKWITNEEMLSITVIAETTPGPVAINCATFVGYKRAGLPGAICATLGVVLPAFVIIYVVSLFLDSFLALTMVANAFRGIKIAVGILILQAGIKLLPQLGKGVLGKVLLAASCLAMLAINIFSLNISSIVLMVCCAAVSVAVFLGKGGGKA